MGTQYVPQVNHLAVEMARWLEEWRREAIPERDDLHGGTDGDNMRHVLIRGAFLDHLFWDKKINAVIEGWVNRTPLKASVQQLERILDDLAKSSKIPLNEIPWNEKCSISIATDENAEILVELDQRAAAILRGCLDELRSLPRSDVFRSVLNDIVELVESLDMPYQWLVIELTQVYFARLFISDYSWQYAGNLEVEQSSDFQPTPEVDFRFQTLPGETLKQTLDRLKTEVGQATDELTRFVEQLP